MSLDKAIQNRLFQPKSPLIDAGTVTTRAAGNDADYRSDLTLQNLLQIGLEQSPEDIIQLRKRARWGDSRWLMSLYDEMMRLGPAAQVLKAREALKGTQTIWQATPEEADEDENSTDPELKTARLIRDVTEEAWKDFLPDLKTHLSTKFFYGMAAVQVMWRPKAIEGRWSKVTDIRPIPARRFRLDQQTLRFKFLNNPFSWEGPYVDDLQATGKLIFVEVGADTEPLDQRGLLFQCLIPWAIEQFTVRWRAKRLQNFGMPPVMVTYPKGDPANKATADALAELLANGTRAVMTTDMKAELLTAAGTGSKGGDPYEANIEWVGRCYDQIILGHSQVSGVQVGAGSKSSSQAAIGLFKDVTNSRAKDIDNDLNQQAYYPYVAREFGDTWALNHSPKTESSVIERDDPVQLSTVALNLFNAGAAGVIAVEDLVERCTLDVAEDGELTLAGNVKGEMPAPAEVDAENKANPPAPPPVQMVGPDGKPLPQMPGQKALPGSGGKVIPGQKEPKAPTPPQPGMAKATKPKAETAEESASFMSIGDFQQPARHVLRRRKGKRAIMEFYTRRQRFAAASVTGGKPRIVITSFGHEHGAPDDSHMNLDVRTLSGAQVYDAARTGRDHEVAAALEAHPMTGAIYGGVRSRVEQAIKAGTVSGEPDLRFGVGCEHGKHRSVYVAERLGRDLRAAGHDVIVQHRDAERVDRSGERGVEHENVVDASERFFSEAQPRDDNGRWAGSGNAETANSHKAHDAAVQHHLAIASHAAARGEHARAEAHSRAAITHAHAAGNPAHSEAARTFSRIAHSLDVLSHVPQPGKSESMGAAEPRFTAIEEFGTAQTVKRKMKAEIAAKVRNRLKAHHERVLAEVAK